MRLASILAAVVLAGVLAASASATARPVTPQDRALLSRPATYEEKIAEQVARRLTGHNASVRCGSLGISDPRVLGVTPLLNGHSFDYFLMRPLQCTNLAWFHQAPTRWDPRTCVESDCARVASMALALAVVAVAASVEVDPGGVVRDARVGLACVADRVVLADPQAVASVVGTVPTSAQLADVARAAAEAVSPEDDVHASGAYRQRLVAVLTRRALAEAIASARGARAA